MPPRVLPFRIPGHPHRAHSPSFTSTAANDASVHTGEQDFPIYQIWRKLPAHAIGSAERVVLADLLQTVRPLGLERWREAVAGDAAAAVAIVLKLAGIDVLDTVRHDVAMSALLMCALDGSSGARSVLTFTLEGRRYVDDDAEPLIASWKTVSPNRARTAALRAIEEALS